MSPIILTVVQDDSGFLVHGPDEKIGVKPFAENEDAMDFLCWCTVNRCTASPLFSLPVHYRGGRCWVIEPQDDDAAFALRMRWL